MPQPSIEEIIKEFRDEFFGYQGFISDKESQIESFLTEKLQQQRAAGWDEGFDDGFKKGQELEIGIN